MKTFIYSLSHPITNEVRYIGKSNKPKDRYKGHLCIRKKSTSRSRNWILSLKNQGLIPVMDIIDEVDYKDWEFWEKYWISQFKAWGFNLTNQQKGGSVGNDFVKFGDDTKLKMRNSQLGKKHTVETKKKISVLKSGVVPSLETRERLRIANIGKKMSPEAIAKTVAAKNRPVIQYDLKTGDKIAEHESVRQAQDALGGKGKNLGTHLKGERPHYMGYRFEYKSKVI